MAPIPRPWACVHCGALAVKAAKGPLPTKCPDCRRAYRNAARARLRNATAGQAPLIEAVPEIQIHPEPVKVPEPSAPAKPAGPRMVTQGNQWSRRGKVPLDLSGCPDDLGEARIWVMEHVFKVRLYRWQKRELRALGGRVHPRRGYVQVGRKNGKSLFAVAFILTELILVPEAAVYAVSDSERNLNSVMVREMRTLIGRSEVADSAFIVTQGGVEYPHNGSFFEVRPNNFRATQGINPTLVVMDEVHLQKTDEIWAGMQMAGAANPGFLLMGITTPGYDLASFAHDLYLAAAAGDPDLYARIFEPANTKCALNDRQAWVESNPRLEDDPDFMGAMEYDFKTLPEHEFRRFRLGVWTATEAAWLPAGAWDKRATGKVVTPADLGPEDQVWLGFDGSFSGDSTALVAVTQDRHVTVAGAWENPGRTDWRVPRDQVDQVIRSWMNANRYVTLLADPPYWERELAEWSAQWPGRVIEFPTHVRGRMAPACTSFYAGVMEGLLTHDGDKRLARHVSNAITKTSPQGDFITKPDPRSPAKIDLAVAAVVAYSVAAAATQRRSSAGVF